MTNVYKLELSEDERHWPIFEDQRIGDGLGLLPDREVYDFILKHGEELKVRLLPARPGSRQPDLKDCDLYQYGHFLFFSARARLALKAIRGFNHRLMPVSAKDRSSLLYLYYAEGGLDLLDEGSEFKTSFQVKGKQVSLFLTQACFDKHKKLEADIFWLQALGDHLHLRETFVTQSFKDTWEGARLVGARFTKVGDFPDELIPEFPV